MPVGRCHPNEKLVCCKNGGNAWGNLKFVPGWARGGNHAKWCQKGEPVGVQVKCKGKIDPKPASCSVRRRKCKLTPYVNGDQAETRCHGTWGFPTPWCWCDHEQKKWCSCFTAKDPERVTWTEMWKIECN